MSGRRSLRVSQGVTNAAAASRSHRSHGIASAQLTARLSGRMGGALLGSASTPALGRRAHSHHSIHVPNLKGGENPLPPLDGWGGATPPRPSTTAGAYGRPSSSNPEIGAGENGRLFTPPKSSPGLSRKEAALENSNNSSYSSGAVVPLYPTTTAVTTNDGVDGFGGSGCGGGGANGLLDDRGADIPLGLSKLDREDLEVYVNIVRANLARQAKKEQAASASLVDDETVQSSAVDVETIAVRNNSQDLTPSRGFQGGGAGSRTGRKAGGRGGGGGGCVRNGRGAPRRVSGKGSSPGAASATAGSGRGRPQGGGAWEGGRSRNRSRNSYYHHHVHHHHHHHQPRQRGKASGGGSTSSAAEASTILSSVKGGGGSGNGNDDGSDMNWFARSKGSRTVPLRTLMLDPEVNNIPQVATQSDFRALIKAQNIPHPSYDIDGDGVVSQEDYALAKRFDVNGDGVLDEAEKVVGRRIMTEVFLDNHKHDLHLYGQGLAQKSIAANVEDISRSRGFKKIIGGLREKEKSFVNHGSDGVRECVTLKPKSLTRHNFYSDKFDTTAWNDFTRDPRDPGWLESRRHDGSRNQMYFMRKVEARESAQGKLNASYRGDDAFSTRRMTLITDPGVENS